MLRITAGKKGSDKNLNLPYLLRGGAKTRDNPPHHPPKWREVH